MGERARARRPLDDRRPRRGSCPTSSAEPGPRLGARRRRERSVYDSAAEPCPARWGGVLDVAFPSRRDEAAAPAGRARRAGRRSVELDPRVNILTRRAGLDDSHPEELSIDAPGADEVAVVPWPLLLRERVVDRHGRQPALPVDRPRGRPVRPVLGRLHHHDPLGVDPADRRASSGSDTSTVTWVVTGPLLAFAVARPGDGQARRPPRPPPRLRAVDGVRVRVRRAHRAVVERRLADRVPHARRRHRRRRRARRRSPSSTGIFPRERRVQAMGYWSMVGAGGPVIGVVAGGPDRRDVRLAVDLHRPGAAHPHRAAARAARAARDRAARRAPASTSPGAGILAIGATSLLFAINRGPSCRVVEPGRSSPASSSRRWPSWPSSLVERRVEHPLLPLAYLRRRNFSFAIATQFFTNFAYMGGFVITPIFLESVFGYPETQRRRPDDRPAAGLRHRRSAGRATSPIRVGERTSAVAGAGVRGRLDGGPVDGGARVVRPRDRRRARPVGRRAGLLVTGAGGQHRQRRRRARPRRGRRLPADDDAARRGHRHPGDADRAPSSAQAAVGEVAAYGEAYLVGAVRGRRSASCAPCSCGRAPDAPRAPRRAPSYELTEPRSSPAELSRSVGGDLLDLGGDLGSADRVRCAGLHGHHLGHVALHLDLAGHEGLHPGLRVAVDEDRLGGGVVERDGEVGVLEVADLHLHLAAGGVQVGLDGAVAEGDVGDDLVHPHGVGGRRRSCPAYSSRIFLAASSHSSDRNAYCATAAYLQLGVGWAGGTVSPRLHCRVQERRAVRPGAAAARRRRASRDGLLVGGHRVHDVAGHEGRQLVERHGDPAGAVEVREVARPSRRRRAP